MTRNLFTNKLIVGIVVVTMLTFTLPNAAADVHDEFGNQVMQEDADFRPTLDLPPADVPMELCHVSIGGTGVGDDWFYFVNDQDTDGVETFSVRLVESDGNAAGTLVRDQDTTELDRSCDGGASADNWNLLFVDQDNSGNYDEGDYVYLTTFAVGNGLQRSSSDDVTIRLTPAEGEDAGTLVSSGDQDFQTYSEDGSDLNGETAGSYDVRGFDATASESWEEGDWLYLTDNDDLGTLNLPSLFDIRLLHENEDFGTQVLHDDADFVPTLTNAGVTNAVCQVDRASGLTEDSFYLDLNDDDEVTRDDVRLNGFGDHGAGTVVRDTHDDSGLACVGDADDTLQSEWIDADDDGEFTDADWVYIGDPATATPADVRVSGSSGDTVWIRLTDTDGGEAGSIVFSGDQDIRNYDSQAFENDLGDAAPLDLGYFDVANTGDFERGDWLYLVVDPDTNLGNDPVPGMFDVRITHEAQDMGSFVTLGDADFVPTMTEAANGPTICQADLGDRFHEDGYYLSWQAAGDPAELERNDIRLVPWQDNPAGSLLSSTDTTELSATSDCDDFNLVWIDVNDDGLYSADDWVYITNQANGVVASDDDNWVVRLTATAEHDPGTLVRSGHNDLVTYGEGDVLTGGDIAFFDADNSGEFRSGDWAYASPDLDGTTDRLGEDDIPNLYDVRLAGTFEVVDPEPDTPPSVTIDMPGDGDEYDIGDTIEISGSAEAGDNDLDAVTLTVGGDEVDVEGLESWNATYEASEGGDLTIEATATDTEDMTGSDSVTVTVQEEMPDPPEISIQSPGDGDEFEPGEEVTIEGTASGEIDEITVTVDNEDLDVTGDESWEATWTASDEAGSFVITAEVTDTADQSASDSVTVSISEADDGTDDEMDDGVDDETDGGEDDETDGGEDDVETPGFSAIAALAAIVGIAALLRRN